MSQISIVIPVYNVDKYLRRCLDSVCAQDECVKEIILVNDGSTDDSLKICKEYCERDARIRIIDKKNEGVSVAIEAGVEAVTSELIGFVDSDDYIEPNMYRSLYDKMTETNADIVFCDYDKVDENGNFIAIPDFGLNTDRNVFEKSNDRFSFALLPSLNNGKCVHGARWNKLFRTEDVRANLVFVKDGMGLGEDLAMTLPIMFSASCVAYVRKNLYHYVQRHSSVMHEMYSRKNFYDWLSLVSVLEISMSKYGYNTDNFGDNQLAMLLNMAVNKLRHSGFSKKERRTEYAFMLQDERVRRLLRTTHVKAGVKYRILFFLLRHNLLRILTLVD